MKDRIVSYVEYIDEMLGDGRDRDWKEEVEKHIRQINFFSHERLVHLLVFMLVALATVICIVAYVATEQIVLLPLIVLLFILLVPYCMHYYLLENSVQKMYEQYDQMMNHISPSYIRQPKK